MTRPAALTTRVSRPVKQAITDNVVALFNDRSRGEKPVVRQTDGMFGPGSVAWRVHGDVTSMMVGGIAALLLQMLHPAVLAGVWDHSNFRSDMHGRLRRTARFVSVTTYGGAAEATAAIERVRSIHDRVTGHLPGGQPYRANDPSLLAWVHVTEAVSFLAGWQRYSGSSLSRADQDRYFQEMATLAERLGADPVPRSRSEALRLMHAMRPGLRCDDRTRQVARLVLSQPAAQVAAEPVQRMMMQAGIDLLPEWARHMHGLPAPGPLTRMGMMGVAGTLRWAFSR